MGAEGWGMRVVDGKLWPGCASSWQGQVCIFHRCDVSRSPFVSSHVVSVLTRRVLDLSLTFVTEMFETMTNRTNVVQKVLR